MQGTEKYISEKQDVEKKRQEYIKEKENYFIKFKEMSVYREKLNVLNTDFYESYKKLHDKKWEYYDAYVKKETTKIITTPNIGQGNNLTSTLESLREKAEKEATTSFETERPSQFQDLLLRGKTIFDKTKKEKEIEIENRLVQAKAALPQNEVKSQSTNIESKSQTKKEQNIETESQAKKEQNVFQTMFNGAYSKGRATFNILKDNIPACSILIPAIGIGIAIGVVGMIAASAILGAIGAYKEHQNFKTAMKEVQTKTFNSSSIFMKGNLTDSACNVLGPTPSC